MVNPLSPTPRAEKPVAWLWIQMILDLSLIHISEPTRPAA